MTQQDIIELAKSLGFKTNHFLRLRDKKSGIEVAGKFTKYKQFHTNGLRIKGENFEVDIITNGEPNFDIIQSVELTSSGIEKTTNNPDCLNIDVTLLDYFAAKAMIVVAQERQETRPKNFVNWIKYLLYHYLMMSFFHVEMVFVDGASETIAKCSYELAEAMVKERKKYTDNV
jgi:hypothetical protein